MLNSTKKAFKRVDVIPNWDAGHFIQWKLDPFFNGVRPYNFSLEISATSDFSELLAAKNDLGDVFFVVDDTKIKQSWAANYSYRIGLQTSDNRKYYSTPVIFGSSRHDQRKYAMAAEVLRKEILLARYAGTEAWLLRRKSIGKQSNVITNQNIDPVSGVPIADIKHEDYGVGVDGGYYAPVPCVFYTEQGQQDKQLDQQGIGVKENYTQIVRMPGYPIIEVRDIVCEAKDGYRYSIQSRNAKQFPGTNITLIQKANLNLIPPTDTAYSIPIPALL
jgi:hypothetical protein